MGFLSAKLNTNPLPTDELPMASLSLDNIKQLDKELPQTPLIRLRDDFKIARSGPSPTSIASTRSVRQPKGSRLPALSRSRPSFRSINKKEQSPRETTPHRPIPRNAMVVNAATMGQDSSDFQERIIAANERRLARHAEEVSQGYFEGPPQTYKPWRTEKKLPDHLAQQLKTLKTATGGWRGVGGAMRSLDDVDELNHEDNETTNRSSDDAGPQPVKLKSWQPSPPAISMRPRDVMRRAAEEYAKGNCPVDPSVSMRPKYVMMRSRMALQEMAVSQRGGNNQVTRQLLPAEVPRIRTPTQFSRKSTQIKVPRTHNSPDEEVVTVRPPASQPRKEVVRSEHTDTLPQGVLKPKVRRQDTRCDEGYHESMAEPVPQRPYQQSVLLKADNVAEGSKLALAAGNTKSSPRVQTFSAPASLPRPLGCPNEPKEPGPSVSLTTTRTERCTADIMPQHTPKSKPKRPGLRSKDIKAQHNVNTSPKELRSTGRKASEPRLLRVSAKRAPVLISNPSHKLARAQYAEWVDESERIRPSLPGPFENEHPESRIQQWLQRLELGSLDGQPESLSRPESQKLSGFEDEGKSCWSDSTFYRHPLSIAFDSFTNEELPQAPQAVNTIPLHAPDSEEMLEPKTRIVRETSNIAGNIRALPQLPKLHNDQEEPAAFDFRVPAYTQASSKAHSLLPGLELVSTPLWDQVEIASTRRVIEQDDNKNDENVVSVHAAKLSRSPGRIEEDLVPANLHNSSNPEEEKTVTPVHPSHTVSLKHDNILLGPDTSYGISKPGEANPTPPDTNDPSTLVFSTSTKETSEDDEDIVNQAPSSISSLRTHTFSPLKLNLSVPYYDGSMRVVPKLSGLYYLKEADISTYPSAEWSSILQDRLSIRRTFGTGEDSGSGADRQPGQGSLLATPERSHHPEAKAEYEKATPSVGIDIFDSVIAITGSYIKGKEENAPPIPLRSSARPTCHPATGHNVHSMQVPKNKILRSKGDGMPQVECSLDRAWLYPHRPNLGMRLGFVRTRRTEGRTKGNAEEKMVEPNTSHDEDLIVFSDTEA